MSKPSDANEQGLLFTNQHLMSMLMTLGLRLLAIFLFIGIAYFCWWRIATKVELSDEYRFSAASIKITKIPPWVPETLVYDVLFTSGLDQKTKIDQKLLQEIAAAFKNYHWVDSVDRVYAKFPNTVYIDLKYREAVCLIQSPKNDGLFAVDKHGVRLPSDYFQKNEGNLLDGYIKVIGVKSMPLRDYGLPWDDIVVEEAAQLAAYLHSDNCLLHIVTMELETIGTGRNVQRVYHLTTTKGKKIIWGTMPIQKNDSRKEYLLELARQYGSPDKAPGQKDVIDLTKFDSQTKSVQ